MQHRLATQTPVQLARSIGGKTLPASQCSPPRPPASGPPASHPSSSCPRCSEPSICWRRICYLAQHIIRSPALLQIRLSAATIANDIHRTRPPSLHPRIFHLFEARPLPCRHTDSSEQPLSSYPRATSPLFEAQPCGPLFSLFAADRLLKTPSHHQPSTRTPTRPPPRVPSHNPMHHPSLKLRSSWPVCVLFFPLVLLLCCSCLHVVAAHLFIDYKMPTKCAMCASVPGPDLCLRLACSWQS